MSYRKPGSPMPWRTLQRLLIHFALALVAVCIGTIIGWLLFMAIQS